MNNDISLGQQRTILDVVERADPTNTMRTAAYPVRPASISCLESLETNLSMSEESENEDACNDKSKVLRVHEAPCDDWGQQQDPTKRTTQNCEKWYSVRQQAWPRQ